MNSPHALSGTFLEYNLELWAGHLAYISREHEFIRALTPAEERLLEGPDWWSSASLFFQVVICFLLLALAGKRILVDWKSSLAICLSYGFASALISSERAPDVLLTLFVWHSAFSFLIVAGVRELLRRKFPTKSGFLNVTTTWRTHRFPLGAGMLRESCLVLPS